MAVPDTTTFTLQDVVNTVNTTTDDLVDCFADAVSGSFDSSYSGSKTSLLNFRNYGGTVPVTITNVTAWGTGTIKVYMASDGVERSFYLQGSFAETSWTNRLYYSSGGFTTYDYVVNLIPANTDYYLRIVMDDGTGLVGPVYYYQA